ncbi:NLR, CARD domain-containing protein 3 [Branchiostoma belcheri]|nr:NLR, CARD domain-containing protein 3 [Branchiostoma belcheri]
MESAHSVDVDIRNGQEPKVRRSIDMKIDVDSTVTDERCDQVLSDDEKLMEVQTDTLEDDLGGSYDDEESSDSDHCVSAIGMTGNTEDSRLRVKCITVSTDMEQADKQPCGDEETCSGNYVVRQDYDSHVPGKQEYIDACKQLGVVPVWSFVRMMRVHRLRIRHRSLGPLGTRAICVPIALSPYITALDLEDNGMGAEGVWHVSEMLKFNQLITTVVSTHTHTPTHHNSEGALAMADMLVENRVITSINLSGNHFGESDGVHFARVLKDNTSLRELILKENEFRENGARLIGKGLVLNSTLRRLDLSWNHIRNKGALAICTAMKKNEGLRDLDVSWNGFSDAGAIAMAATLKVNVTLADLDLTNNRIGPTGVRAIANALLVNQTLTTLRMGKNNVPYEEGTILLKAIKKNKNSAMSELDLTVAPAL